ncbi:uncharacterized protein G2W53_020024 [Senna tora]|uniref:Uncharacterized protein n=1 Tax=Senna tora TaxID=362788 RepID=A0A834WMH9_9FABA|nr:uncharacterized protein G2W53_020024 [Senna tora]
MTTPLLIKQSHSVSCYRPSNPSNLQQQQRPVFGAPTPITAYPYRWNHVNPSSSSYYPHASESKTHQLQ